MNLLPRSAEVRRRWQHGWEPPRVMGIDVARALAVVGMMCVHLGSPTDLVWLDPTTWSGIVNGRSAVLFCLLAGVSISLATSAHPPATSIGVLEDRLRLVGRGVAVFSIGIALELLNTGISVILPLYGLLFVVVIPFRRWPARRLFIAAAGLALVGPLVVELLRVLAIAPTGPGLALTVFNFYPVTAWLALMLAGMGLGRLPIGSVAVAASLVGAGIALAVIGYGCGALVDTHLAYQGPGGLSSESITRSTSFVASGTVTSSSGGYLNRIQEGGSISDAVGSVLSSSPHSGGILELFGSGGFAMAVIGLCVLFSRGLGWWLTPLAAMGSMPLTAYVAHVVIVFVVSGGPAGTLTPTMGLWAWSVAGVIGGCAAWKALVGRGPLERLVTACAEVAAREQPRRRAPRAAERLNPAEEIRDGDTSPRKVDPARDVSCG